MPSRTPRVTVATAPAIVTAPAEAAGDQTVNDDGDLVHHVLTAAAALGSAAAPQVAGGRAVVIDDTTVGLIRAGRLFLLADSYLRAYLLHVDGREPGAAGAADPGYCEVPSVELADPARLADLVSAALTARRGGA